MSDIRWEDPSPAPKRGREGIWVRTLEPLMDHPKRWAIIQVSSTQPGAASSARNLRIRAVRIPSGHWEFTSRTVDGEHRVYGRYLGPDEDGA